MTTLSVICPTGWRPEAFKISCNYLARQTYKNPIQFIVVDDSPKIEELKPILKSLPSHISVELYPAPRMWEPGINTQRENCLELLQHVKGEKLFIWEDEDRFAPNYLEHMSKVLDYVEIAGETNSPYYHLQVPGWMTMGNYRHASLCQTSMRSSLIPNFKAAIESGQLYFDIHLWEQVHTQRKSCALFEGLNLVVGIKGMAGRPGIGAGHRTKGYLYDGKLVKLREWIGDDVELYKPFVRKYEKESKSPIVRGNESSQRKLNGQARNDGRARGEATKQS